MLKHSLYWCEWIELALHDIAGAALILIRSIRVLCNADTSEGFNPSKDVSFPEIHLQTGEIKGLTGSLSPSRWPILAFFAGRLHGHIRHLLLKQWKEKDQDVRVYDQLPNGVSYELMLKKSKYYLCPSGYEVASPRVVEAIYAECVPVLISDGYVPPFNYVLNWKLFSVQVKVEDIPNIKTILLGISETQYLRMHRSETSPKALCGQWNPQEIWRLSHDSSLYLTREVEYHNSGLVS